MKNTPDNHHFNNSAEEQQDEDVKLSSLRSRVRKGQVQALNSSPSDKQQQLVLDDDGVDEDDDESAASDSVRFEIGDLVWGKIKSHPWWPGQIYNQAFASAEVRSGGIEGQVLVAFFGDGSYGWFYPAQLVPFDYRFSENCRQSGSRNFGRAVEEAVEEVTRRSALPFVCRCRNRDGFRPSDVEGYFCVGEIGSLYSGDLIRKGRDGFQPREMVAFLNQLAVAPTGDEDRGIGFIKSKAAVMAYRKAVYQEVDDTYAREFGHIPDVRSSLKKALGTGRSPKMPIRGFERIHNMTAEAFAFTTESSEELRKPFEFCSFKIIKSRFTYVIKLHYPGKKSCSVTADASFKLFVEGQPYMEMWKGMDMESSGMVKINQREKQYAKSRWI